MYAAEKRIAWIDCLKFIACLGVMGSHFFYAFFNPDIVGRLDNGIVSIFLNGNFWVCVFCILSGLFTGRKEIRSGTELLTVCLLRYLRFVLPLCVTAVFIFLLACLCGFSMQQYSLELHNPWLAEFYRRPIVFTDYLKLIFCFASDLNGPLWMMPALFCGNLLLFLCSYLAFLSGLDNEAFVLPLFLGLLIMSVFYDALALYTACCVFGGLLPRIWQLLPELSRVQSSLLFLVWISIFAEHSVLTGTSAYYNAGYACVFLCLLFNLLRDVRPAGFWNYLTPLSFNIFLWHWPLFCGVALPLYGRTGGNAFGIYLSIAFTVLGVFALSIIYRNTLEPVSDMFYSRVKEYIALR